MPARSTLAFVVLIATTAGCVTSLDQPLAPASLAPRPLALVPGEPIAQDHDHADATLHNGSFGFEVVGFSSAWGDGTAFGGGVNELAVQGDYVYLSRAAPEGGLAIVDVANPREPRVVGEWFAEGGADVEVSYDGRYAFLFSQRTVPDPLALAGSPREHVPRGIYVVDVSDKSRPRFESFLPLPANGPHTGAYHRTSDGRELIAVQTYDLFTNPTTGSLEAVNPATQRVILYEVVRSAAGVDLAPLSVYQLAEPAPPGLLYFPHDSFIQEHPLTGQLLMYVAYWDAGLRIVDVTDPRRPTEIGRFEDFAPSAIASLHYAEAFPALIAGRHVTVVAPEIVTAPEAGQLTVIDTTDPANPVKLGHFSLPGELVVDAPFRFSPHNFDLDPWGRIYYGHNHAGVWVVDVGSEERLAEPLAIAYHEPDTSMRTDRLVEMRVWGAMWQDGLVYATEGSTGLHVLRLKDNALLPAPPGALPPQGSTDGL